MPENNEEKKKEQSADEIARIMAENMRLNIADPDFLNRNERLRDEVRKEILEKRRLREGKNK